MNYFEECTEITQKQLKQLKLNKMKITKQVEELKLYFDTDQIVNKSKLEELTMPEFIAIKLKIKNEKKDDVYHISSRIFLQMMDSVVFIYDYSDNEKLV